ncbi:MAG TPA: asparagine synthase-related protein [Terracidiphilus sp.]|jgi:asparagine synthase (glutamine-hydrolysing)
MAICFGICKGEGRVVEEQQLIDMARATERYAVDGTSVRADGRIGMGFQPYHTHQRSRLEAQPAVDERGNVLTLDGRIDNHVELCHLLDLGRDEITDSRIVLAAFGRWGEDCFSRLVGDWSVCLWSKEDRSLYLARDHAGTRTLYFSMTSDTICWATHLETLLVGRDSRELSPEFVACYLSGRPIGDWTPFRRINAVTPSHFFVFHDGRLSRRSHWQWMITDKIRYRADVDYEEHFRILFRKSVERRTGPGAPILAQLSGGMDSTSIVCMSDGLRASSIPPGKPIDSISYYDDSEPSWNERPYFSLVEQVRGKVGIHANASLIPQTFRAHDSTSGEYLFPGADSSSIERERYFEFLDQDHHYRAILSGIGGDELLGGVPTPLPELAGYLASGNVTRFLRAVLEWSVTNRTSVIEMAREAALFTLTLYRRRVLRAADFPSWITLELRRRCAPNPADPVPRWLVGIPPNSISNAQTWWDTLETLPHRFPSLLSRREWRYPYLDRELVEFLFRIPRSQLVRPGRRRSLMRRGLKDIVPAGILDRRRKAFVVRSPIVALQANAAELEKLFCAPIAADYGFIEPNRLRDLIHAVVSGREVMRWAELMRAVALELWLSTLASAPNGISETSDARTRLLS